MDSSFDGRYANAREGKFQFRVRQDTATLDDFIHLKAIKDFLDRDEADWESRAQRGWTTRRREQLLQACDRILTRPQWPDQARAALTSQDETTFYQANRVAETLGFDTWPHHWDRLRAKPDDARRWLDVMMRSNDYRIGEIVAFAEQSINLGEVATGAGDELGLGPGFEAHWCLGHVMQELHKHPGHGEKLVEAALRTPVVRDRNSAVAALAAWGRDRWSTTLHEALKRAAKVEPHRELRLRMEAVLRGESLSE